MSEDFRKPLWALTFADQATPWRWKFAWFPVRTIDRRWVWLKRVMACRAVMKQHAPNATEDFEVYWYPFGYVKEAR
jgi:hypothetical protein